MVCSSMCLCMCLLSRLEALWIISIVSSFRTAPRVWHFFCTCCIIMWLSYVVECEQLLWYFGETHIEYSLRRSPNSWEVACEEVRLISTERDVLIKLDVSNLSGRHDLLRCETSFSTRWRHTRTRKYTIHIFSAKVWPIVDHQHGIIAWSMTMHSESQSRLFV